MVSSPRVSAAMILSINASTAGSAMPARLNEPGLLQQLRCLGQQRAILSRTVGNRRQIRLAEHLVRHLGAERLKQRELCLARLAFRHHAGILEYRDSALVSTVHDRFVGPFEIER